jgi:hypothetical protein
VKGFFLAAKTTNTSGDEFAQSNNAQSPNTSKSYHHQKAHPKDRPLLLGWDSNNLLQSISIAD